MLQYGAFLLSFRGKRHKKADLSEEAVRKIISQQTADLPKVGKPYAEHLVDFDILIYNVLFLKTKQISH